jgi:hypothetical protein
MSAVHVLSRITLIAGSVVVGGIAALMDRVAGTLLPGWDGNRYAFVIAGMALVGGGAAAKTGAMLIEDQTPPSAPQQRVTSGNDEAGS